MHNDTTKEKQPQAVNNVAVDTATLMDIKNGEKRPWRPKKVKSLILADSLHRLEKHKKANRVWWCCSELGFRRNLETNEVKLETANFCRERLCPMCAWRKSIRVFHQVSKIMDLTEERHPDMVPTFLSLSMRNCTADKLTGEIDIIFKSWNRFMNHYTVKNLVHGWYRALEVTYDGDTHISQARYQSNPKYYDSRGIKPGDANPNYDTFHPHLHIILLVHKSYFKSEKYLKTEDWVRLWRVSMGVNYDPICDIRKIKANKGKHKAVAEVAKYTLKDSEYLTRDKALTDKLVGVYDKALYRRRLYAFGGILKKIAKELGAERPEEGDLINIDAEAIREDIATALEVYHWDLGITDYVKHRSVEVYPVIK